MDFIEYIGIDLVESLCGVGVAGIDGVGEEGEEVGDEGVGDGVGVGEEDLGAVGVVPGAFLGVGEDFVGVLEFLELRGGFFLGDTRFHELVGVALQGEAAVGGADLVGGAVAGEAEDFVVATLCRRRRRHCWLPVPKVRAPGLRLLVKLQILVIMGSA